jgi:hypothetical protein
VTSGWRYLLGGVLVGGVLVFAYPAVWHRIRPLVTWLHEGGHAVATLVLSGKVRGMRLNRDTSGVTRCAMAERRGLFKHFRAGVVSLAGTPSPMVVGAGVGVGLYFGYVHLVLGLLFGGLVLTLPLLRNWWGLRILLILGVIFVVSWVAGAATSAVVLGLVAGVASLGGLKTVYEGHRPAEERDGTYDAEAAAADFHVPVVWIEGLWVGVWAATIVGAVMAMRLG